MGSEALPGVGPWSVSHCGFLLLSLLPCLLSENGLGRGREHQFRSDNQGGVEGDIETFVSCVRKPVGHKKQQD